MKFSIGNTENRRIPFKGYKYKILNPKLAQSLHNRGRKIRKDGQNINTYLKYQCIFKRSIPTQNINTYSVL